jgi:Flp pilus assembly protein TadG
MRCFTRIARDERGASVVELALVAPFLAALVIGMVDISRGYSHKVQLEQAAQRSVEKAMQGKKNTTLFGTLQAEAMTAASVPASNVEVKYWLECNGVSQYQSKATMTADYEKVCPSGQQYARYVEVTITKNYAPMFQTKFLGSKADGTFDVIGKAGIRVQ